jgi:ribonuclease HII
MRADTVTLDLEWFEIDACSRGFRRVAGVDEAGRGPLAGPVVAAAVILNRETPLDGIRDSKQLTPRKRREAYHRICRDALAIGVGVIDAGVIDHINILQAALFAMAVAVEHLDPRPDYLLIDGTHCTALPLAQKAIPKGDARSVSIAAASIVAKVTRDQLMERYHERFPDYRFDQHKGYPTLAHREAVRKFGCCPIHRRSFKGVSDSSGVSPGMTWPGECR